MSEVLKLAKLLLVISVTDATRERSLTQEHCNCKCFKSLYHVSCTLRKDQLAHFGRSGQGFHR